MKITKVLTVAVSLYSVTGYAVLSDSPSVKGSIRALALANGVPASDADSVVDRLIQESKSNGALNIRKGQQKPLIDRILEIKRGLSAKAGKDVSVAPPSREELKTMAPSLMAASGPVVEAAASSFIGEVQGHFDEVLADLTREVDAAAAEVKEVTDNVPVAAVNVSAAKLALIQAAEPKRTSILAHITEARKMHAAIKDAIDSGKPVTPATLTSADAELAKTRNMLRDYNTAIYEMIINYIFDKALARSYVSLADANTIDPATALDVGGVDFKYKGRLKMGSVENIFNAAGAYVSSNAVIIIENTNDAAIADIGNEITVTNFQNMLASSGITGDVDWPLLESTGSSFVMADIAADKTIDFADDGTTVKLVNPNP